MEVNYGFHCADFHETQNALIILRGYFVQHRILGRSVHKYGQYMQRSVTTPQRVENCLTHAGRKNL